MRFVILLLLLSSCASRPMLQVQSDYVARDSLASEFVGTPDPKRECPPVGQRLVFSWSIPERFWETGPITLVITSRYYNRTECVKEVVLGRKRGAFEWRIMDEEYFRTRGGVQTFKADLMAKDVCIDSWRHILWTERFEVGE